MVVCSFRNSHPNEISALPAPRAPRRRTPADPRPAPRAPDPEPRPDAEFRRRAPPVARGSAAEDPENPCFFCDPSGFRGLPRASGRCGVRGWARELPSGVVSRGGALAGVADRGGVLWAGLFGSRFGLEVRVLALARPSMNRRSRPDDTNATRAALASAFTTGVSKAQATTPPARPRTSQRFTATSGRGQKPPFWPSRGGSSRRSADVAAGSHRGVAPLRRSSGRPASPAARLPAVAA